MRLLKLDTELPYDSAIPYDSAMPLLGIHTEETKSESEVAQSCLTPSDPMDYRLPGSSIHGIFQARVLEWVAIAFPKENPKEALLSQISETIP